MRSLVLESLQSRRLANLATSLWSGSVSVTELINRVDNHLRRYFVWTEDAINNVPMEAIRTPDYMIQGREMNGSYIGDCDDISTLEAAMLTVLGIRCRFVVIRSKEESFGYDHVYVEAYDGIKWIVSDITVPKDTVHKYYQRMEIAI